MACVLVACYANVSLKHLYFKHARNVKPSPPAVDLKRNVSVDMCKQLPVICASAQLFQRNVITEHGIIY